MIFGIAGAARAGKDTTGAAILKAVGGVRVAFADALKAEVCDTFGLSQEFVAENKEKIRPLLVEWGRARRMIQPDYWVKAAEAKVVSAAETGVVAITDVRYKNEAEWVLGLGGFVIYVTRPGFPPANAEERESLGEMREWLRRECDGRYVYLENVAGIREIEALAVKLAKARLA